MNDKKTITRSLRCNLTDKELLECARTSAEITRGIAALEEDKSRTNKDFAARIAEKESGRSILNEKITTGYELREVECAVAFDKPKKGAKTIFRLDTEEQVSVEQMTQADMQRDLPLDGYKFDTAGVCTNPGQIVLRCSNGIDAAILIAKHPVDDKWYSGLLIAGIKPVGDLICRIDNTPYDNATGAAQAAFERFRQHLTSRIDDDQDQEAGVMHAWLVERKEKVSQAARLVSSGKGVVVE